MSTKPAHVYQIYIRSTPESVWQALTDPEMTAQYYSYPGTRIESEFTPGAPYVYRTADGRNVLDGTIIESDPPRRLVMTFRPLWTGQGDKAPVSQVTWEIDPHEDLSRLTLVHEGLDPDSEFGRAVDEGWIRIVSAMKTFLETESALFATAR